MAVLRPLKVVLTNYPEGQVEEVDVINNPEDPAAGTRKVPFSRVLYIERDDFKEDPPKKFFRLSPGKEVRLRCAYFITCTEVIKDDRGEIVELRVHLRSGDPRRRCARRPPREGDAALGVGGPRAADRSAAVRSVCSASRIPRRSAKARHFSTTSTPLRSRCCTDCSGRAQPRDRCGARALPIRADRVFLRRSRFETRRAGLQPHRLAAGHLGQNRAEAAALALTPPPPASSGAVLAAGPKD